MYTTDKIAILMATYNGETYIDEQIESLLKQTFDQWELYVHDDASQDNTVKIIEKYSQKYPDKIHILTGAGTGNAKNNFFYLMRNVEAPYIMFCDQDDIWMEEKIEITFKHMLTIEKQLGNSVPVLVFSDLRVVDENLNIIADRMSEYQKLNPNRIHFRDIILQSIATGCTMMLNRSCVIKSLELRELSDIIMHDWWCSLTASYFGIMSYINASLILYRQHKNNSVGAKAVSNLNYIINKMSKGSDIKNALAMTRKQALVFAKTYKLGNSCLASEYGKLSELNKIKRLLFYVKNRIYKSGFFRNIGLIIWG